MEPELPDALVDRLHRLVDDGDALLEALTSPRPPAIRVNTLKVDPERARSAMEEAGLAIEPIGWLPHAHRVTAGEPGRTLPHFLGWIYVQSASSMLPPLAVRDALDDACVLDGCAAPGSKTTQLAQLMGNSGAIVANDRTEGRIAALKGNLGRCGVANAVVTQEDLRFVDWEADAFDVALVDAPCSGEGILRKSWGPLEHWTEHRVRSIGGVQKQLLDRAIDLTRPGGRVVYSTCTFGPEECEAVVDHALATRDVDVVPLDLEVPARPGVTAWGDETYDDRVASCARIYPHDVDTDGFFLGVLAT